MIADPSTNPALFELQTKCAELSSALLEKHPRMPTLLAEIHRTLRAQPENLTLLSEEEISRIIAGLEVQTKTELAASVGKGSAVTNAKRQIQNLGADAF